MQWIIYPDENDIIAKYYLNRFKLLKNNQILLENAFTFPRYRGLGLFAAVTSDLLEKAKDEGYKSAITYIRKNALDSLNEFMKQGFKLNAIIREYKILGITKRML
jgi:L-amino acid N-acyltransferase YncA